MALSRRRSDSINIWPGFVDALTQLTMVMVFVLLVFTIAQFYLSGAVGERDQTIQKLTAQLHTLDDLLGLDKQKIEGLNGVLDQANASLKTVTAARDTLAQQAAEKDTSIVALNQNVDALRAQLTALSQELDLANAANKDQAAKIDDLATKLNVALAKKVEELAAYRSEFFGKLREILGSRSDVRVVGDRFVFQSEVLFQQGSATLGTDAKKRLLPLVAALRDISAKIPPDIHWILEVDGHTDPRPIATAQFHSNWDLSSARAASVVTFLTSQGIPPDHLAAAGFAQYQPLVAGDTEDAWHKDRRIELKLTQH